MSVNDPIADLLTAFGMPSLRAVCNRDADSNIKAEIARVLKEEGFIESYEVVDGEKSFEHVLRIRLKYVGERRQRQPCHHRHRTSEPAGPPCLYPQTGNSLVPFWVGIAILSTPKGVMTGSALASSMLAAIHLQGMVARKAHRRIKSVPNWSLTGVVPQGVQVNLDGSLVHIKGPKGELSANFPRRLPSPSKMGKSRDAQL